MTKPKTLEQLRTEKERAGEQLAQEQHKPGKVIRKIELAKRRIFLAIF